MGLMENFSNRLMVVIGFIVYSKVSKAQVSQAPLRGWVLPVTAFMIHSFHDS